MNETPKRPTRKVSVVVLGGAVATIVVYTLNQIGITVEPEVSAAIATIAAFLLAYVVPEGE